MKHTTILFLLFAFYSCSPVKFYAYVRQNNGWHNTGITGTKTNVKVVYDLPYNRYREINSDVWLPIVSDTIYLNEHYYSYQNKY